MQCNSILCRKSVRIVVLCLCLYNLFIGICATRNLKFVQAIWRHGDRAPYCKPYPNDEHDISCWPNGWMDLTDIGVKQLNDMGEFFRTRYADSFVNSSFDKKEIQIFSSKETRALESAESMRKSFFPDTSKTKKNTASSWKPVPIYTAPDYVTYVGYVFLGTKSYLGLPFGSLRATDRSNILSRSVMKVAKLIKPTSFDCPKYNRLRGAIMPDIIANITSNYNSLFQFLGNVSGYGVNIIYEQVLQIYDVYREIANGLPQPDWVYKVWEEYGGNSTLQLLEEMQRLRRFHENFHNQFAYLRGGSLLGEWLTRLKNVSTGIQVAPTKMVLYSSHDGTLQALMHVMEVSNYQLIPYASCILMEIYENKRGDYQVEIFFRDKDGNLDVIIPLNCTFPCPLSNFLKIYDPKAIFSFKKLAEECEANELIHEGSVTTTKNPIEKSDE